MGDMTFLKRRPDWVLGAAIMDQGPKQQQGVVALPWLVFHLAREDRGDEGEEEQRDLQLARLDKQLNRGVARNESSKVRKHHAGRRRREHIERELLLLGLDEICELGRNLAEGENSIDIPARARNTPSLVRSARAVHAERTKDASTQRGVCQTGRRVEESGCEPKTHTRHLANRRFCLSDHLELGDCLELRSGGASAARRWRVLDWRSLEQRRKLAAPGGPLRVVVATHMLPPNEDVGHRPLLRNFKKCRLQFLSVLAFIELYRCIRL